MNIPHNEKVGYYTVNNKRYDNKWDAMLEATTSGLEYKWEFAPNIFDKFNWTKPIEASLDSLYAARLQQLRDKYDHLVLFFSGGKDSLNILMTSINNHILLDEIVVYYPFVMEKSFNNKTVDSDNLYSEVEYAAKPILKSLEHKLDPRTKIRFQDIGETTDKFHAQADWFDQIRPANTLQMVSPSYGGACDEKLIELASLGKRGCVITGADKPNVKELDGNYYFSFVDVSFNSIPRPKSREMVAQYEHMAYEAFYQTPELPELVIKQAQVLAQVMDIDPKLRQLQNPIFPVTMTKQEIQEASNAVMSEKERLVATYLYSDGIQPWQTKKHKKHLYRRGEKVVWETLSNTVRDNYMNGLHSVVKQINPKFFINSDYILGPIPKFTKSYLIKPTNYKEV